MFVTARQLEVLDLRHFSAPALRPLLQDQAAVWDRRLLWDYTRSVNLLLEYIDGRSLTGYVALRGGRVAGYSFGVCESSKAILGDVYAFGEAEGQDNPVCELLLDHLLETLQATPGVDRIESQLLLFPYDALQGPFLSRGMHAFPRLFMLCDLANAPPAAPRDCLRPEPWYPEAYASAAALIHEAYAGHMDSQINDQYQSVAGAKRFLHNIVHFPGCGIFDAAHSWLLRDAASGELQGMILCSRVKGDAAHITQLCVRPSYRGRGFGRALLTHSLAQLSRDGFKTVSLTVTERNEAAQELYLQHGFRTLHRFEAWVWNKNPARK